RVAIAVVDLAHAERLAERLELVSGRKKRDAQSSINARFVDAERSEHADLGGAQRLSRAKHDRAAPQILAREAAILTRFRNCAWCNRDAAGNFARALLHHDRIGAGGHYGAGENAHRFAGAHFAFE